MVCISLRSNYVKLLIYTRRKYDALGGLTQIKVVWCQEEHVGRSWGLEFPSKQMEKYSLAILSLKKGWKYRQNNNNMMMIPIRKEH